MKGLLIKKTWSDQIMLCMKTWEIRSHPIKQKDLPMKIALLETKPTCRVVGEVTIVDCVKLSKEDMKDTDMYHRIPLNKIDSLVTYKQPYAWVLENPHVYPYIKTYTPKRGCVTWVKDI